MRVSTEEYEARILHMERYVERLAFLCPDGCRGWWHHANATVAYLQDVIDADFYEMPRPAYPDTGVAHLNEDLARHRDYFNRRWAIDAMGRRADAVA